MVIYSRFDYKVLSRLSLVFYFGNGTDILNPSSHKWDFSLSMADIYRAVSNVVTGHERDVNNHELRQPPSIMRHL